MTGPTLAQTLIARLHARDFQIKSSRHKSRMSTRSVLFSLLEYFKTVDSIANKKKFQDTYLIGCIYHDKRYLKNTEYVNFARAQLHLAVKSFGAFLSKIDADSLNHFQILKYKDKIIAYIFDMKPFVEFFERKFQPDFQLFVGFDVKVNTTLELFKTLEALFWYPNINPKLLDQKATFNLLTFAIRQAIEVKFKRIFGIVDLYNKNYSGPKLRHDFFVNFVKEHLEYFETPKLPLQYVIKIYEWSNYTIHNAINPRIWEIQFAMDQLSPWFAVYTETFGSKTTSSAYGAVRIKKFEELKSKIFESIDKIVNDTYCVVLRSPEAMLR